MKNSMPIITVKNVDESIHRKAAALASDLNGLTREQVIDKIHRGYLDTELSRFGHTVSNTLTVADTQQLLHWLVAALSRLELVHIVTELATSLGLRFTLSVEDSTKHGITFKVYTKGCKVTVYHDSDYLDLSCMPAVEANTPPVGDYVKKEKEFLRNTITEVLERERLLEETLEITVDSTTPRSPA